LSELFVVLHLFNSWKLSALLCREIKVRKEKKRKQQAAAAAAAAKTPQGKGPATWHGGMVSTAVAGDASPQEHLRQAKRTLNEYREAKEWAKAAEHLGKMETVLKPLLAQPPPAAGYGVDKVSRRKKKPQRHYVPSLPCVCVKSDLIICGNLV
jgi:hypothetical protein